MFGWWENKLEMALLMMLMTSNHWEQWHHHPSDCLGRIIAEGGSGVGSSGSWLRHWQKSQKRIWWVSNTLLGLPLSLSHQPIIHCHVHHRISHHGSLTHINSYDLHSLCNAFYWWWLIPHSYAYSPPILAPHLFLSSSLYLVVVFYGLCTLPALKLLVYSRDLYGPGS